MARKPKPPSRPIAVIDTETDPFKYGRLPEPFIYGYYNGELYRQFDDKEKLIEFLMDRKELVYAHNGGKFDYHFFLDYLTEGEPITIINGRLAEFKIGECLFRDSMNILPIGLAQFEKQEFDYRILERDHRDLPGNREKIEEYLRSDCVNLYEMVIAWEAQYGRELTLASTAMKQWQKMSGKKFPNSDEAYFDEFDKYYYGGRVQCFEKGIINDYFEGADIHSAYPRAMCESHAFSVSVSFVETMPTFDQGLDSLACKGFYSVYGVSRGAFPYRDMDANGKLRFPDDEIAREYHITGWELLAALETDTFKMIRFCGGYIHDEFVDFREYVDHFYELKLQADIEGDKAAYIFAKLLMNALYGKTAADPSQYKRFYITQDDERIESAIMHDRGYQHYGQFGPWALMARGLQEDERRYYNIATAASITGYVRAFLWRSICSCEGVIYCDTDSLFARNIDSLKLSPALGDWGLEGKFEFGAVAGRKLYAFKSVDPKAFKGEGWKYASKGSRLTPDEICEVASGGSVWYQFDAPTYSVGKAPVFVSRNILPTA